ncbi:Ig-like domain-containing protein [Massilia sp. H-1]|nr:Ig-like domain-containing protein [Massilia sp. H-1]
MRPLAGEIRTALPSVQANVSDALSGVKLVEFSIDGGVYAAMPGTDGSYAANVTAALADGGHTVRLRATDNGGTISPTLAVSFVVDTKAPVITVTGVAKGATYTAPVKPVFSATDTNLDKVVATLDGVAYVSGQQVAAAGAHVLLVTATDKAGNKAESSVNFTLTATLVLSGSLDVTPGEGQQGTPVTITPSIINGGATLDNAVVEIGIVSATGLSYSDTRTVTLVGGATWSGSFGWNVNLPPGGYQIMVTVFAGGTSKIVTQRAFTVLETQTTLKASLAPTPVPEPAGADPVPAHGASGHRSECALDGHTRRPGRQREMRRRARADPLALPRRYRRGQQGRHQHHRFLARTRQGRLQRLLGQRRRHQAAAAVADPARQPACAWANR